MTDSSRPTAFAAMVNLPDYRVLPALLDGPATAAQVARALDIDVEDAERRLAACCEDGRVARADNEGQPLYALSEDARKTARSMQDIAKVLFPGAKPTEALWLACLETYDGSSPEAAFDPSLGKASDEPAKVEELLVLPVLQAGAASADDVAEVLSLPVEESDRMLQWCVDAGLVKSRRRGGYILRRPGRVLADLETTEIRYSDALELRRRVARAEHHR